MSDRVIESLRVFWMISLGVVMLLNQSVWAKPEHASSSKISTISKPLALTGSLASSKNTRRSSKAPLSVSGTLYADTGVLDLRTSVALSNWQVGLWRGERLIKRYRCKRSRCPLTLPQPELKALIQRWDSETDQEADPSKSSALLPWKTRPDLAKPPLRSTPEGVWIGWETRRDIDPIKPVIIDKIRVNRAMITGDELIATQEPVKVRLAYPELVKSVSCVGAECVLATRSMRFFAIDPRRAQVRIKFHF